MSKQTRRLLTSGALGERVPGCPFSDEGHPDYDLRNFYREAELEAEDTDSDEDSDSDGSESESESCEGGPGEPYIT